ncbi:MAG TPA: T9SS type A sorting domain-containing protein, partial [Bacteroidales bacterium]|nr:T9SS type A sorting domain-containing protein [Bacteroidales bacterium]
NSTDFYGEYYPKGHLGTSIIRYTFFDMNNAVDSASMIAVYVATPVGIEELVENDNILLYPNPTSGIANLNLDLKNDLTLEIFNSLGVRVLQENILNNSIDLSLLPEGIYYYRIKENNHIKTNNILVIQK